MNYSSHEFILLFLPAVLALFYLVPMRLRIPVLCLSSFFFYGVSGLTPLAFLIMSVIWGYFAAFRLARKKTVLNVLIALSFPLAVLFCFKYLSFTLDTFGAGQGVRDRFYLLLSVVLPAGISFYTFQIIGYDLDVADKRIPPERDFLKLLTFFSLFLHLIAGPILRYEDLSAQLDRLATEKKLKPDFIKGLKYLSFGLTGKIFFADFLNSACADKVRPGTVLSSVDALYSIIAYSFRIYYDFWAYSLIAIALGKMLSLDIVKNFEEPYLSENPKEFWRRWHRTLSFWIRDYIYLKIGGNKHYVRNIIVIFLIVGLWHGAGWNFVAWGGYHALLVIAYHVLQKPWNKLPRPVRIALTFTLVSLGWPLFYLDMAGFARLMTQLFGFGPAMPHLFRPLHWAFLAVVAAFTFGMREKTWLYNEKPVWIFDSPVVHAGLCFLAVVFFTFGVTFIYFQF